MPKELILSLTKKDFEFEYFRAGGKGGQKQNKTSSGCRCRHIASGAVGEARDSRSQDQNRRAAFMRMYESDKFQNWFKKAVAQASMTRDERRKLELWVEGEINNNVKIEVLTDNGWQEES